MNFKRYVSEAEVSLSRPVTGDGFNIVVNETVNIKTAVKEHSTDSVTIELDSKALAVLEGVGITLGTPLAEEDNFTIDDIKDLESIRDLNAAKAKALQLISHQGKHSMKPNKIAWFKHTIASKKSVVDVIKLMYDLMLSGEGHGVVGSGSTMNPNSYRKAFGEQEVAFESWFKNNKSSVNEEMADLRRLSGLSEDKTRSYIVVHLPNGQTTKRQFTITASSDEEAKSIAATRMKDRPDSKLISVKHNHPTMHKTNLVGESTLTEGYEDRVQAAANALIGFSEHTAIDKSELGWYIEYAARQTDATEYKMKDNPKSKAWSQFVQDVKKAISGKVRYKNRASASRAAATNEKLSSIAQYIQDAVSNSFPDGDPIDYLIPKMRRLGIDSYETGDWLDKAAKKYLHSKSYHGYLHDVWQDFMNDNPGKFGLTDNPWTSESLEEDDDEILRVAESTIADRIVTVTNQLEKKKEQKKSGSGFDTKVDEKIAALKRELKTLQKRTPVAESSDLKVFVVTNEGNKYLNFSDSVVNIVKGQTSGSVVLHQVSESANKSTPWMCRVTTEKSVGSAYIPRK